MKRTKINKLIALFILGITILGFKPITTLADTILSPFNISESSIIYQDKEYQQKPKILLYSSHSQEEYLDGYNVIEVQKDLKNKLEKKGFIVDITTEDFTRNDYNNSYNKSYNYISKLNLEKYKLIIDLHRDARSSYNAPTTINGMSYSRCRFVYSKSDIDTNRQSLGDNILSYAADYGVVEESISYSKGIFGKNQKLANNSFLMEIGTEKDSRWEVKRTTTIIANAIEKWIDSN